ncbi:MAG TPA: hypothetical protein PKL65_01235 [Bacteroidales bacterium]|nr:hypothetical protein [Bacteroidales bacterium]HNR40831.1 hypothetical protein [Bacteroidales bacterium]
MINNFYLFYCNGTERSQNNQGWSVYVKKGNNPNDLLTNKPYEVLRSEKSLAAPDVAFYNNFYYLLAKKLNKTNDKWGTTVFQSDEVDKAYPRVTNNPILSQNNACASQYVSDGNLYVIYSLSES